jgi:hypothetical protein
MEQEQESRIKEGRQDLNRIPEWKELTGQEQNNLLADLENLKISVTPDLSGLHRLVNQEYTIHDQLKDFKQRVQQIGQQRVQARIREEQKDFDSKQNKTITRQLKPRNRITTLSDLDELIRSLQQVRGEFVQAHAFELILEITDSNDPEKQNNGI